MVGETAGFRAVGPVALHLLVAGEAELVCPEIESHCARCVGEAKCQVPSGGRGVCWWMVVERRQAFVEEGGRLPVYKTFPSDELRRLDCTSGLRKARQGNQLEWGG